MTGFIQDFKKFQPLLSELLARDIKVRYRRSVLGVLWTLLNPLLMMIVLSIVFSNLFKFDVENFPLYLLSGQVVFNYFSNATTSSMTAITDNASLIKKVYVPKYMFVLARITSNFINLLASFTALLLVMIATRAELHYTVIFVIIPIVMLVIFSLGIGLMLAAAVVRFRDIMHLYSVLITALMYLTPMIYPMNILPEWLKQIVLLNPITNYLIIFRDVMLYNNLPGLSYIVIGGIEAILALALGIYVFRKSQDEFILNI